MALRQLVIGKKIETLRAQLAALEADVKSLTTRSEEMKIREAELEAAVGEVNGETPEADRASVEEAVESFERDSAALEAEQSGHDAQKSVIEDEIRALQEELSALNERAKTPPIKNTQERKDGETMKNRGVFFGLAAEQRDAFFQRGEVSEFLTRTREFAQQKRGVSGAELLIPSVVLELVRENIQNYSKLVGKINLKPVPGKARQNVMGTVPEGIWMEACGTLNELNLSFSAAEVEGYKVGGFIAICNATLEDSDIALATEIISSLGQAIGYAIDKAVLYGTGIKMPLGIMTRLAQLAKPTDYPSFAREWNDLHVINIQKLGTASKPLSGLELYKTLIIASGAAKGRYSRGGKFWAMSDATFTKLMAEAMSINAAGAIVSGQMGTMPVIGGDIVTLDFIPDGDIIGGYGDLFLMAERAGAAIESSGHVRFIEDQTVFKGVARYDGTPVIGEGFVAVNIKGAEVTTSVSFAEDKANATTEETA